MINPPFLIAAEEDVSDARIKFIEAKLALDRNKKIETEKNQPRVEVLVGSKSIRLRSKQLDERAVIGISFHNGAANHRRLYGGGKSQHLAKAVGVDQKKGLSVFDVTAGLASDSFVLASLGAKVQMLERSPVLALMIEEALLEAKSLENIDLDLLEIIDRMSVLQEDAVEWLSRQAQGLCEVIFLDPMFPERKKKAAVKKEMQVLQHLLMETEKSESDRLEEEAELLEVALSKAVHRVVVKRPRHAPVLAGKKPDYCIEGKSTRFDIYPLKKIS